MEFLRPILKDDPTNIFDAIVDKLYKDSDYSLEKVQGVVKGRLREIEYEKRTTMVAAQKFENVSMKVIYATKEQMITEKLTIDFIIISKEKFDFCNFYLMEKRRMSRRRFFYVFSMNISIKIIISLYICNVKNK